MKEKIYTIDINEAIDEKGFCPFCTLFKKLDYQKVDYTLGPSMMEADFRLVTNKKGFCARHIREILSRSKALGTSLILDTHLNEVEDIFNFDLKEDKKKLFKKGTDKKEEFLSLLEKLNSSCAVCDMVEQTFSRYFETFIYMLKTEDDFLNKVLDTDGFCIPHFTKLFKIAKDKLSKKEFDKLFYPVMDMQKQKIVKYHLYVKEFSESYDYRNVKKEKNFPKDTLYKVSELLCSEFDPKKKDLNNI